jgi:putative ABC transport system permease protein
VLNATLKGLRAHALRLLLTGLAVVLGVAFVSGTLMLTDSMRAAFDEVVTNTAGGIDLQLRGEAAFSSSTGITEERAPVPPDLLEELRAVEGVRIAEGVVQGAAQLVGADGEPLGGGGPPTIGANAPSEEGLGGIRLASGRLPTAEGEIAIDVATAEAQGFAAGDTITVVTPLGPEQVELTGTIRFGEASTLAGATVTLFEPAAALERFSPDGSWTTAELYLAEGADPDAVAAAVEAVAGDGFEVLTAQELVDETLESIGGFLDVFATALLVFAGVSLFVGAFIIFNTFSIIVAQRTREFALLRAIGASRRQVLAAMLAEAGVTGLVASVIGVGVGALVALGMVELLAAFNLELPSSGLVFSGRTVVVGIVVGVAVTMVAALVPVLRSTRVPPVAALQAVAAPPAPRAGSARYVLGGLVTAGGVAALVAGLFADAGITVVGAGAALVFLGITVLSPLFATPVIRLIGAPVAAGLGVRGRLARENAMRNPRRTASTAAALMIGLGLVGFVTIFAASLKDSSAGAVDAVFAADLQVRSSTFTGLPAGLADDIAALPEVGLVGTQQTAELRVGDRGGFAVAMDPTTMDELFRLDVEEGSTAALADGGILMTPALAEAGGWEVGDAVPVTFALTGETELVLRGTFTGAADVQYVIDDGTYAANVRSVDVFSVLVKLADGVAPADGRAAVEAAVADVPAAQVTDREGFREEIEGQINQLLGLVFGLLGLSVVIALFGIVNTLALSVFERVRELGLLRAIGMTRRQVRAMVRWEAVLIAILGALLGLVVGVFFAWILGRALAEQLTVFTIPGGQLAVAVVLAALAGVLAGVLPARRAAKVDVLKAITVE